MSGYYYEVDRPPGGSYYRFRVYRYDQSGNVDITVFQSEHDYASENGAADAAVDWCEDHGLEVEEG